MRREKRNSRSLATLGMTTRVVVLGMTTRVVVLGMTTRVVVLGMTTRAVVFATATWVVVLALATRLSAQAVPAPDIYLAPLSMQNGKPVVGPPLNVTHRPGYDNQPSFTPDSKSILFTSTHDDGQSD